MSRRGPVVALACALLVAGCGGSGSSGSRPPPAPPTTPSGPSASPQVRSAEHDAREDAGQDERAYTEPNGRPIAPEPQGREPNHGTPGNQDATGGKVDIPIRKRHFTQPRMTVKVGQIVVFTDDDDVPHTVRNVRRGLPHSRLIPVGGRFEFTPLQPGTVVYHCIVHPQMRGELLVKRR